MYNIRQLITAITISIPLFCHANDESWMQSAALSLDNNQADKALAILEPKMEQHAGELAYDILLGRAAYANDQANLAIFALERVVLVSPKEDGARFTLAKAYIKQGEIRQARKELSYIAHASRNTKFKKLSRIFLENLQNPNKSNFKLLLKAGLGSDTNVNSATDNDSFLGFILSENSKAISSSSTMGNIIAKYSNQITNKLTINIGADYFKQDFSEASFANLTATSINAGLNYKFRKHITDKISFFARKTDVGQQNNNTQLGTLFTHRHIVGKKNQFSVLLKYGRTDYVKAFDIKDTDQLNTGLQHRFTTRTSTKDLLVTTLSAIAGKDLPLDSSSPYNRTYTGAQAGIILQNRYNKVNVVANVNYMNSKYNSRFYGQERIENNMGANLKINMKLFSKWKVSPVLSYARNQSSVDLYDFERTQINLVVSHQLI